MCNVFGHLKFDPKIGYFWPFCLINPFAKCPKTAILGTFGSSLSPGILGVFARRILPETNLRWFRVVKSNYSHDLIAISKSSRLLNLDPEIGHFLPFGRMNPFAKCPKSAIF